MSFSPFVDFCVWSLVRNGLNVPPFDQHGARSAPLPLHAGSFTPDAWTEWLVRAVQHDHFSRGSGADTGQHSTADPTCGASPALTPDHLWPAENPDIRHAIGMDWVVYRSGPTQQVKRRLAREVRTWSARRTLTDALQVYADRLKFLTVYVVDYPVVVLLPVPPQYAVVGVGTGDRDEQLKLVINAARNLSDSS